MSEKRIAHLARLEKLINQINEVRKEAWLLKAEFFDIGADEGGNSLARASRFIQVAQNDLLDYVGLVNFKPEKLPKKEKEALGL